MSDIDPLLSDLASEGQSAWAATLRQRSEELKASSRHGLQTKWQDVLDALPEVSDLRYDLTLPAVTLQGQIDPEAQQRLPDQLMALHPWRKGPFHLFGIDIDTEWRSDLKWSRVANGLNLRDASVLDVGCGNGYYGWRMLGAGAKRVIGLEPFPLYIHQHRVIQNYLPHLANHVLAGSDLDIPSDLEAFDVAFSMGVLYHRTSPIDHLKSMFAALRPGGQIVLETLIVDEPGMELFVPEGRYAKMRNVWFIPSISMLLRFLKRCNFKRYEVLDVSTTTIHEQRSTAWMTFESLPNFLLPDGSATVEGYPVPKRAIVLAERP